MKVIYPNYVGRMREIESNISEADKEILGEYINYCGLSAGEDKVNQRKRYALQFLDIAEVSFNEFNREMIEHIYKLIKNTERETIGKNEVIKNLRRFIEWKFQDLNLLKGIKSLVVRKGYNTQKINSSTLVTKEEIESLIRACKNLKEKAMVCLLIELGLRPQELLCLKWRDIKINEDIGEVKVFSNKTKETRTLPFKTSLIHILRWKDEYNFSNRKENDLIFPNPLTRKQLYRTYISTLFRRLCRDAGIRQIYPYLCRHTKMTEMNKKLPSKVASAFGGHSEKTACLYTHLNDSDIREIVLKEIYDIKEPDIKTKKKLEQEIKLIKKEFNEIKTKEIDNAIILNQLLEILKINNSKLKIHKQLIEIEKEKNNL